MNTYIEKARRKSERARLADTTKKTGVATGARAHNPATGETIPIWIADYVLSGYGTGAIMAVPGHDQRDYEFAKVFALPIVEVVRGGDLDVEAYTGPGTAIHSGFLDGLTSNEAVGRMNTWLEAEGLGEATVNYKLRDWLFSRQRYWGEPFPIIHREDGTVALVPESDLPLTLPELQDFRPTGDFSAPLARVSDWIKTTDPETGAPAKRDSNTMPQWAGSCWYFLRFVDPDNNLEPWSEAAERYWMPVDLYMGGAEHAVLHLLYARFWHKVFYDLGLVHTVEPFQKLVNQGMILGYSYRYYDDNISDDPKVEPRAYSASQVRTDGERIVSAEDGRELKARWMQLNEVEKTDDGDFRAPALPDLELEEVIEKMSKSRGNVLTPDDVIDEFGADSMRLYEMFIGPIEKAAPWSTEGMQGVRRFLDRTWRLLLNEDREGNETLREFASSPGENESRLLAKTIAGVTEDIEAMRFNTAISKLMVFVRDIGREPGLAKSSAEALVKLLSPFAPHFAEELWKRLDHGPTITYEKWPEASAKHLIEETIVIVVQVNGKRRDEIVAAANASEETLKKAAIALETVQKHLQGREPRKVIVVPGRLINVVG